MVSRLSIGKSGNDEAFARISASTDRTRSTLLDLAAQDAEAFESVMQSLRLPKETAEEKQRRATAVQKALIRATDVPLQVASHAVDLLEISVELTRTGNPAAVSDAGVAALLAHASGQGALLNVRINLSAIKDETYRAQAADRVRALGLRADVLRDEALAAVNQRLDARSGRGQP